MAKRQPYFINPRGRRMAKKRRKLPRRGKGGRFLKSVRRRGGRKVSRRAWRASSFRRNKRMARRLPARSASGRFLKRRRAGGRRRRRRNAYLSTVNPRRRRRRNPPAIFTARGIMGAAQDAAVGGAGVVVGEIGARQGITLLRLDPSQPLGIAGQFAVALGLGMLARQFRIGGTFGKAVVYGAAAGGVRSVLRLLAPDVAGRLLAGDDGYEVPLGAYEDQRALPSGQGAETMMGMYTTGVM